MHYYTKKTFVATAKKSPQYKNLNALMLEKHKALKCKFSLHYNQYHYGLKYLAPDWL